MGRKATIPVEYKQRGVYLIVNHANSKVYVGSTHATFYDRWQQHIDHLRKNKHNNPYLQHAWNKYGESMFEFMVLEIIEDESNILEAEQFYLDIFFGEGNYNINPQAASPYGKATKTRSKNIYLISPDGIEHGPITNAAHFAKEHGLSQVGLYAVIQNECFQHRGWKLKGAIETDFMPSFARAIILQAPNGDLFGPIPNITVFAKEHNLVSASLHQLTTGKIKLYKGWKLISSNPVSQAKANTGKPNKRKLSADLVLALYKNNPTASLRWFARETNLNYLTIRNILLDAGIVLESKGNKQTVRKKK